MSCFVAFVERVDFLCVLYRSLRFLLLQLWTNVSDCKGAFFKGTSNFSNSQSLQKHVASEKHQLVVEAEQVSRAPIKSTIKQSSKLSY